MELILNDFSYEELNIDEATALKNSFLAFKNIVEHKLMPQQTTFGSVTTGDRDTDKAQIRKKSDTNAEHDNLQISRVSHEIRTPLSGIIGFTDLLLESELSGEQLQQVTAIQSASHVLIEIVNELLEYSKISMGTAHFETIDFSLHRLVNDVTFLCRTLITAKNVRLTANIDKNIPKVLAGDPTKLNQILLNLLGNAIKFVQVGEIELHISLKKLKGSKAFLEFNISDTGIGIPKKDLEHIFDPYMQSEHSQADGHGLGLSIVKKIIEALDGDISVTSSLGQGTTFTFNLPFAIGKEEKINQKNIASQVKPNGLEIIKNKCILVFEDDLLNQKLIAQRLKSWQCKVIVTDDPNHGLELLENNKIDLVLMDLWMPIMTGFEAAERIRQNKNSSIRALPIIILTADLSLKNQELCITHGINDFVHKPYNPEELLSKLLKNLADMNSNENHARLPEKSQLDKSDVLSKVDLTPILEDCMGDLSLLAELVRLYKQNALEFMGAVKLHLQESNFEGIKFAAHKIKSGLAMMQTFSLREIAVDIHNICEANQDIDELRRLAIVFADEYLTIEKSINEQLIVITSENNE